MMALRDILGYTRMDKSKNSLHQQLEVTQNLRHTRHVLQRPKEGLIHKNDLSKTTYNIERWNTINVG